MLTKLMMTQRGNAYVRNLENIISCLEKNPNANLCDFGCDDGVLTVKLGGVVSTKLLFGSELTENLAGWHNVFIFFLEYSPFKNLSSTLASFHCAFISSKYTKPQSSLSILGNGR
jgi:hypothetical protein